jgi:hypothetical protein
MLNDGEIIEVDGYLFKVEIQRDDCMGAPWEEHDGHGPVTEWTSRREKKPGERVLSTDRWSRRYYDAQEATAIAKRDGWGLCPKGIEELTKRLGHAPTPGQIINAAVDKDFEYLRRWCADLWEWKYVRVVNVIEHDGDYEEQRHEDSCGGIDGDADDYIQEMAYDLANGLAKQLAKEEEADAESERAERIRAATRYVARYL